MKSSEGHVARPEREPCLVFDLLLLLTREADLLNVGEELPEGALSTSSTGKASESPVTGSDCATGRCRSASTEGAGRSAICCSTFVEKEKPVDHSEKKRKS